MFRLLKSSSLLLVGTASKLLRMGRAVRAKPPVLGSLIWWIEAGFSGSREIRVSLYRHSDDTGAVKSMSSNLNQLPLRHGWRLVEAHGEIYY
jgi:hypothetical protein